MNKLQSLLTIWLISLSINGLFYCQDLSVLLLRESKDKINSGQYGEAIDLLNRYISANPRDVEGYNLKGFCHEKRAEFESAVYYYRSALKLDPENSTVNENLTRTLRLWNKILYNKIEGHKREIAIDPDKAVNYLEIGKSYKNLGEWEEAEKWYDVYLRMEKASPDEIIRYTEILAQNNHISKGELILKKYCEEFPDDHRLWSRYGYFSYWLGEKNTAIYAFRNALELRPFFKEAMDGLYLAQGKGYIYIINDTVSYRRSGLEGYKKYAGYPVDNYYLALQSQPLNHQLRIKLIRELIKTERFEEAYQQLQKLQMYQQEIENFDQLKDEVLKKREEFILNQINIYKEKLKTDASDQESLLKLVGYLFESGDKSVGFDYMKNFLEKNPNARDVRYNYALRLLWEGRYKAAKIQAEILLDLHPQNDSYKILWSKLSYWLNEDLSIAASLLSQVIGKDPGNTDALITLINLKLALDENKEAENYNLLLLKNDPDNLQGKKLKYIIELEKLRDDAEKNNKLLSRARALQINDSCTQAIEFYNKYLSNAGTNPNVLGELAQAYICSGNYNRAVAIYDSILSIRYDYNTDKIRAQTILWSGDSVKALNEFKRLAEGNRDDYELMLWLGDAYMMNNQTGKAKEIYNLIAEKFPDSRLIERRMNWLGYPGGGGIFSLADFPIYSLISPEINVYEDNLQFGLNTQTLSFEAGLTPYISVGISGVNGALTSESDRVNFNNITGRLLLRLNSVAQISINTGKTFFTGYSDLPFTEVKISISKINSYNITGFFISQDASLLLYSPFLLDRRFQSDIFGADGYYMLKGGMEIFGKYYFISLPDENNKANNFTFRLGKSFEGGVKAGYEYYYYDFSEASSLYWSPDNFESHSLWGDLALYEGDEGKILIGGRIGLIPDSDFVLREFFGSISYQLTNGFSLQGKISGLNTSRDDQGYRSISFRINAFWSL